MIEFVKMCHTMCVCACACMRACVCKCLCAHVSVCLREKERGSGVGGRREEGVGRREGRRKRNKVKGICTLGFKAMLYVSVSERACICVCILL